MQIFYFSTALSDQIYNEIVHRCKRFKPTYSGVGFDRNVAVGLSEIADITGVSLFPIPSYPKYSKLKQGTRDYSEKCFNCHVPAIVSLPIIKEFCFAFSAFLYVIKKKKKNEKQVVLVSGLYRSLLRPAGWLKKWFGMTVVAIVPDLPELMITYRQDYSGVRAMFNKMDMQISMQFRQCVDGFVELSRYMEPFANPEGKPYALMDGLCDLSVLERIEAKPMLKGRFVLYAGKVSSTFGVDKLTTAFLEAELNNCSLVVCGDGDYVPELRKIAKKNSNIIFLGVQPHEYVVGLEKGAMLLVEPRPSDTEIAKMSFPSKIIEYMASGTPVLVTNIPSIGDEYKEYQYRIEDESVEGLAAALKEVLNLPLDELRAKGNAAKEFILKNKTIGHQCWKVFDLIQNIAQ